MKNVQEGANIPRELQNTMVLPSHADSKDLGFKFLKLLNDRATLVDWKSSILLVKN